MTMAQAHKWAPPQDATADAWLSALMDGELDDDEAGRAITRLGKDAGAMRIWSEYGLIGDALRGCVQDTASLDRRVKVALAAEPTVLAPLAKSHRQPVYWVAAAAVVAVISWTVVSMAPNNPGVPVAVNGAPNAPQMVEDERVRPTSAQDMAANEVAPYLVAHQDYAFTVAGAPDMNITPVSLSGDAR